jgi:TPR repeat protein
MRRFGSVCASQRGRARLRTGCGLCNGMRRAATAGHFEAQAQLGLCCAHGTGVVQDMMQAVHWLEKAAAAGSAYAQARLSELRAERAAATLAPVSCPPNARVNLSRGIAAGAASCFECSQLFA